jgi:tripartite-type tricarboxylate transporter receptor subunit TctC
MIVPRRRFLHLAAGGAVLPALPRIASAIDYPTRPVLLLAGFAAGGPLDTIARLTAQWLSKHLGQSFIVENRPGAASNLATEEAARANPDGYTLLLCSSANAWNAALYEKLNFDFVRDIAPVASIDRAGGVMEVSLSLPVKTVPEFIGYAKARPGKLNMVTGGPGSASGLWGALFNKMAGVNLVPVDYRGTGPALPDLISGRVQVMFDVAVTAVGPVKAGKVRGLGVTTADRIAALPDIPPIGEYVPGYEAIGWHGIGAPRNTPPRVIEMLNRTVNAALDDPTFKARLTSVGVEPFASSPPEFGKFIVEFTDKWGNLIREAGIKVE